MNLVLTSFDLNSNKSHSEYYPLYNTSYPTRTALKLAERTCSRKPALTILTEHL